MGEEEGDIVRKRPHSFISLKALGQRTHKGMYQDDEEEGRDDISLSQTTQKGGSTLSGKRPAPMGGPH